jgi:hypothetical protein
MRTLLEFLVAAGLALMFHFGLRLEREAYVLFGVGVLLTLAVHLVLDRMHALHRQTAEAINRVTRLEATLERVKDPEAVVKGRAVIETAQQVLGLLSQGTIPLTEGEYYYEASRCLDRCEREITAVNSVDITDWIGKVQKINYYRNQVRTSRRGVAIARIFVIHRNELTNPDVVRTIVNQRDDGITVRLALYEDLMFSGRDGIEMPTNFVLFDGRELIARTPLLGMYYGKKSHDPGEIARYRRVYEILDQHARPVEALVPRAEGAAALPLVS